MPQVLDDWPSIIRLPKDRPPEGDPADPGVQAAFCRYVQRLGPFMLPDTRRLFAAVDDAHFENDSSPVGPQRCVIVDGAPHAGKTYTALAKAFVETRDQWEGTAISNDPAVSRVIPWAYVEIPPEARASSVLLSILIFCGMPQGATRGNTATILMTQLRRIAPQVGLRGVIIDDSHGIAGTDPRLVADILKTAVTGIPATVVVCGANLRTRGLFDSLGGRQVAERANWVHLGDWAPPQKKAPFGAWAELVTHIEKAKVLPDPAKQVNLNSLQVLTLLANGSLQQPGSAIKWLKRAAVHAIRHQSDLDQSSLMSTSQVR